ncbi:hypothetical protein GN956_G1916 [Arapaima gigas]
MQKETQEKSCIKNEEESFQKVPATTILFKCYRRCRKKEHKFVLKVHNEVSVAVMGSDLPTTRCWQQ